MRGSVYKRGSTWTWVLDVGVDPMTGKRRQRMACRMLAVAADMIDDRSRGGCGPRAEMTASAPATAGWIAAGSNTSATRTVSPSGRVGSLVEGLTTAGTVWPA